jgi:hypothetical protein
MVGDWVIYMEPVKAGRKGYHAVAKVDRITPDPSSPGMHLAVIDPNSYLDFDHQVPFQSGGDYPERSVLNAAGNVSGRAQAAVRPIPPEDFNRHSRRIAPALRSRNRRSSGGGTGAVRVRAGSRSVAHEANDPRPHFQDAGAESL